jgi:hypothetical protein
MPGHLNIFLVSGDNNLANDVTVFIRVKSAVIKKNGKSEGNTILTKRDIPFILDFI